MTKTVPGCRARFPQESFLSNPPPIPIPQSHHPLSPSDGVVPPPARDLGSWDNGARSTKHNAVTKVSSLAGLFKQWEVRPLELDMAGLSVPDNKLCLVRSAFMGSVVLLSRAMPTFPRSISGFCVWATVLRNPPKQKGPPWLVISHI